MKKKLSFLLAILTLFTISFSSVSTYAKSLENPYSQFVDDPYYEISSDLINGLKDKLVRLPGSGSINVDFLFQQILLHRAILLISSSITSYTTNPELIDIVDDILDYYAGELKELRLELAKLIESLKDKENLAEDGEYMKEYKPIVDKLVKSLSEINADATAESIYIKQALALLEASNALAKNNDKYTKNNLVKATSEDIIKNTEVYMSRLKTLEATFK